MVGVTETWTTVRIDPDEVPPPGVGLNTVMEGVPTEATSEAGMDAVNCEELTYVVVLALPLTLTTDDGRKLVP